MVALVGSPEVFEVDDPGISVTPCIGSWLYSDFPGCSDCFWPPKLFIVTSQLRRYFARFHLIAINAKIRGNQLDNRQVGVDLTTLRLLLKVLRVGELVVTVELGCIWMDMLCQREMMPSDPSMRTVLSSRVKVSWILIGGIWFRM